MILNIQPNSLGNSKVLQILQLSVCFFPSQVQAEPDCGGRFCWPLQGPDGDVPGLGRRQSPEGFGQHTSQRQLRIQTAGGHRRLQSVQVRPEQKILALISKSFNIHVLIIIICFLSVSRCNVQGQEDRRVLGLELDKDHHALFVAFTSCVIRVPLSRCTQHGACKK